MVGTMPSADEGGNAKAIQLHSPFPAALGSRLQEVSILKGLEQSLYFKTHLLKAPREFLLLKYLSNLTGITKSIVTMPL